MSTESTTLSSGKTLEQLQEVTILFAGDSGDGMQLTGSQFTLASALAFNDLATLPDFPAEIRAPAGTTYGVSAFQLRFGSVNVRTPGDEVDLLVAMNAAALKVTLNRVRRGGTIIVNTNSFEKRDLDLAGYTSNPLKDNSLKDYQVIPVELTRLTRESLKDTGMDFKAIDRSKNMFALGLSLWLYSRPLEPVIDWIERKFASKPEIKEANIRVLKRGSTTVRRLKTLRIAMRSARRRWSPVRTASFAATRRSRWVWWRRRSRASSLSFTGRIRLHPHPTCCTSSRSSNSSA